MGERAELADSETEALLCGISLGANLLDTAEMYGGGGSERLIGGLLRSGLVKREDVALMTKVRPENSSPPALFENCDASLDRLGAAYVDFYLLHWRGGADLREVAGGMEELARRGKIRRWGVSNFDVADMEELFDVPGGKNCAVNQVLYHLGSRGIEYDLLPWLRRRGVKTVAYCPLAQGGALRRTAPDFATDATLGAIAQKYGASVFQVMLAFVIHNGACAIPKASSAAHAAENAAAPALADALSAEDWAALDAAYAPPSAKMHLDMD